MDTHGVTFDTTLLGVGNNTGIEVSEAQLEMLGSGRRPSLDVIVNGYHFRAALGSMNGRPMLAFSRAHREASGLEAGDAIHVELRVATEPRPVDLPPEFREALEASKTYVFFSSLSNGLQRYHCDQIRDAKTETTRQRRIAKAIEGFRQGKKR